MVEVEGQANTVTVAGHYAFVGTGYAGLSIVDVSEPEAASVVGVWQGRVQQQVTDVVVQGDRAVAADVNGIFVLDVANPHAPEAISTMLPLDGVSDLAWLGDSIYAPTSRGLRIADLSGVAGPTIVGAIDWPTRTTALSVSGTRAAVSASTTDVYLLDVENPDEPRVVGLWSTPPDGYTAYPGVLLLDDNRLFVVGVFEVWIVDVSDAANPRLIGTINLGRPTTSLALNGDTLFLSDYDGLTAFDVSTPTAPHELGRLEGMARCMQYAHGYLFALADQDLRVIDVADPTRPVLVGSLAGRFNSITIEGDHAYVAEGSLTVLDIEPPRSPRRVGSARREDGLFTGVAQVNASGGYVYATDESQVVRVFDVSEPTAPFDAGGWRAPSANLLLPVVVDDVAYLSNGSGGLSILRRTEAPRIYLPLLTLQPQLPAETPEVRSIGPISTWILVSLRRNWPLRPA